MRIPLNNQFFWETVHGDSLIRADVIKTDPEKGETDVDIAQAKISTKAINSGLTPKRAGDKELPTPMRTITGCIPTKARTTEKLMIKTDMRYTDPKDNANIAEEAHSPASV